MAKMNRMVWAACLTAVLSWGPALSVRADQGRSGNGSNIEVLKEKLGLSGDQVAKIQALRERDKSQRESLLARMKADRTSLNAKMKSKASDSEINAAKAAVQNDREAMRAMGTKEREEFKAILTPEQLAKLQELRGRGGK